MQKRLEYEKHDYYAILGLPGNACASEVKRKYRQLALQWHPDKHPEKDRQRATENFRQVAEAHEVLAVEDSKAEYDEIWRRVHASNSCRVPRVYSQAEYRASQAEERERKLREQALARKAADEAERQHYFAKMCNESGVDQIAAQQFFINACHESGIARNDTHNHDFDDIFNRLPRSKRHYRSRF